MPGLCVPGAAGAWLGRAGDRSLGKEAAMRKKRTKRGLTVNAVGGTHVVLLGLDLADAQRRGCLGFAIQREDHTEHERYWMSGTKTFKETDPGLGPGGRVSSRGHPFQSFQWADYSAKPEHEYTYAVIPLYGTPAKLEEGTGVSVRVTTEAELGRPHSVFFNRGAVASQEYARRFQNQDPDEAGEAAFRWLSRGLLEALVAFVGRANGKGFGLYGAVYEFQWPDALAAVRQAHQRGAKVHVLFDDMGPSKANRAAIKAAKIRALCRGRVHGKLMHNKFFVSTKNLLCMSLPVVRGVQSPLIFAAAMASSFRLRGPEPPGMPS